ncbi:MAG: hypothetical protein EOP34_01770 [Rickettsiales bacterium]|nr:MAG: hypothetical protein EOP34_01770 [Rickettsiales bacterium]
MYTCNFNFNPYDADIEEVMLNLIDRLSHLRHLFVIHGSMVENLTTLITNAEITYGQNLNYQFVPLDLQQHLT